MVTVGHTPLRNAKLPKNSLYDKSNDTDHAKQLINYNNRDTYTHILCNDQPRRSHFGVI